MQSLDNEEFIYGYLVRVVDGQLLNNANIFHSRASAENYAAHHCDKTRELEVIRVGHRVVSSWGGGE